MFEFAYHDNELFENLKYQSRIHQKSEYDFTFENRFLIYHYPALNRYLYVAYDKKTGYGSEVCRRKTEIKPVGYHTMLKDILYSIKYTGDSRYLGCFKQDPIKVIDSVFRVILPEYGYAVREEQIRLCKEMYIGLTKRQAAICEAEVGTGKTMAYLVAGLIAKMTGFYTEEPVTITTSSIELQKAIVEREIPTLSKILYEYGLLDRPLTAVLRKGKDHYFCKMRYRDFVAAASEHPEKYAHLLRQFKVCNFENCAFDMDEIKMPTMLKAKISVQGNCAKCKMKNNCKYASFRERTSDIHKVDFQVTNHNLYLTDMRLRAFEGNQLLLPSHYVIIDEAHKLREVSQCIFGEQLYQGAVPRYLNSVKFLCGEKTDLTEYKMLLSTANSLNERLFDSLRQKALTCEADEGVLLIDLNTEENKNISQLLETIKCIEHYRKKPTPHTAIRSHSIVEALKSMTATGRVNIWVEIDENGKFTLCSCTKQLGEVMYEKVWNRNRSHVLTSGTLSDGTDFEYLKDEIGLDHIKMHFLLETHTDSPFDYQNHARLYLPTGIPHPSVTDTETYINAIADNIEQLVHVTNGHTAILFTSYKTLHAVHGKLADKLNGYDVICMTKSNKTAIGDFKKSKNAVLFASGSMWEGVDVAGDKLSSVIIVRLPFPMASSFTELKKEGCEDIQEFIRSYAIPEMAIKLRQGVGRLIRTETDTGVVSILDARANDRYRDIVGSVLGKYPKISSISEVEDFLRAVKPKEYFN